MLVTLRQSTKIILLQIIIKRIEMIVKELQGLLKIIQMLITLIYLVMLITLKLTPLIKMRITK